MDRSDNVLYISVKADFHSKWDVQQTVEDFKVLSTRKKKSISVRIKINVLKDSSRSDLS